MIDLFVEHPYIDLWSLSHFLFGVILFFYLKPDRKYVNFLFILIVATLWEFFEIFVRVFEYSTNRVSDVIVTFVGFYFAVLLSKRFDISKKIAIWSFIILNILGWSSYIFL